jgi:hypothetical protein
MGPDSMSVCIRILAAAALVGSLAANPARAGDYNFTRVDGPALNDGGTHLAGINNNGSVAGVTHDAGYNAQGFFGPPAGALTPLWLPYGSAAFWPYQAVITPQCGGVAVGQGGIYYNGINDSGVTVGSILDPYNQSFGFVRDAAGNFTLIDFPGASETGGVVGINNSGTIVGNDLDAGDVEHGFIGTPTAAP